MIGQIGNTPLVRLKNLPSTFDIKCQVYAKCEFLNPTGDVSDRFVLQQFRGAPKDVLLSTGHVITHGDPETHMSSSWLSSVGKLIPVSLSDDISKTNPEYKNLMKALGTRVIPFCSGENKAESLANTLEKIDFAISNKFFVSSQLTPLNVATAYATLGQEIKTQLGDLKPNMIVCGRDNEGAALFGVTMNLRGDIQDSGSEDEGATNQDSVVISVGVDFSENRFYEESFPSTKMPLKQVPFEWEFTMPEDGDKSQRMFEVEKTLELFSGNSELWRKRSEVTKFVKSSDAASYFTARRLIREEGLLVGPKAGAVLNAAIKEITEDSELRENEDAVVVVILNGSLWNDSREFLSDQWMLENGFFVEDNMESLYWWYNMPVMTIKSDPLVMLPQSMQAGDALAALRKTKAGKGIVFRTPDCVESKPLGVISLEILEVLDNEEKQSTVEKFCCDNMAIIDSRANISELVSLLDNHSFVIISQKSPTLKTVGNVGIGNVENSTQDLDEEGNNTNNNVAENGNAIIPQCDSLLEVSSSSPEVEMGIMEIVLGVLDTRDLVCFQRELEVHHEVNYGIRLSDGIPSCDWYKVFV